MKIPWYRWHLHTIIETRREMYNLYNKVWDVIFYALALFQRQSIPPVLDDTFQYLIHNNWIKTGPKCGIAFNCQTNNEQFIACLLGGHKILYLGSENFAEWWLLESKYLDVLVVVSISFLQQPSMVQNLLFQLMVIIYVPWSLL